MTSNIGIFGYLGFGDGAACWIRHWVDRRSRIDLGLSILSLYTSSSICSSPGAFCSAFPKLRFSNAYQHLRRHLRQAGGRLVWTGIEADGFASGRLLNRVYLLLAISPWRLLQHCSKTSIVADAAPCQDLERLRSRNSKETRAIDHVAISKKYQNLQGLPIKIE